jgi:hypothetical protein
MHGTVTTPSPSKSWLGDARWRDLVERHHATVRALLARYRGREIDTAGDGFFASFDGPARAVRCAEAAVEAVRPLGIEIRAGLHTGEVETIGDKVRGIAVNIGARIGGMARASEVLVSQTVKDLVAGSGLEFEDRGEYLLEGVPEARRVFAARGAETSVSRDFAAGSPRPTSMGVGGCNRDGTATNISSKTARFGDTSARISALRSLRGEGDDTVGADRSARGADRAPACRREAVRDDHPAALRREGRRARPLRLLDRRHGATRPRHSSRARPRAASVRPRRASPVLRGPSPP